LLEEFVRRVLNEDGSFVLEKESGRKDTEYRQFLQCTVGKGKYIYGFRGWCADFNTELTKQPELVAIVADGTVYTIADYFFDIWNAWRNKGEGLTENHAFFGAKKKEINEYVRTVVFKDFYDKLNIDTALAQITVKECRSEVRNIMLSKAFTEVGISDMFDEQDVAKILCGLMDLEDEAVQRFEKNRDEWISHKAKSAKIKELIESSAVVKDWELRLAEGLRSVNARAVTVEFEYNDNKALGKIEPARITRILIEEDNFDNWDFVTRPQGEQIFKTLGASSYGNGGNALKCEHISRITYGKKDLYVRNN